MWYVAHAREAEGSYILVLRAQDNGHSRNQMACRIRMFMRSSGPLDSCLTQIRHSTHVPDQIRCDWKRAPKSQAFKASNAEVGLAGSWTRAEGELGVCHLQPVGRSEMSFATY